MGATTGAESLAMQQDPAESGDLDGYFGHFRCRHLDVEKYCNFAKRASRTDVEYMLRAVSYSRDNV